VFFLLNWNAYRQRRELELTPEDLYDIGTALRAHASSTLLGVMPREFAIPHKDVGIWKTWDFDVAYAARAAGVPRDARFLQVAGLLKPGVTSGSAQAELDGIAGKLAADHPQFNRGWGVTLVPLHGVEITTS